MLRTVLRLCIIAVCMLIAVPAFAADPAPSPGGLTAEQYLLVALAALAGIRTIIDVLLAGLKWLAPRTATTVDDTARDDLQLVHDKLDSLARVVQGIAQQTVPKEASPVRIIPGSGTAAMLALLFIGLLAGSQISCSGTTTQRVENGGAAAFSCELPTVIAAGLQLGPVFRDAITGVLSNDGLHVDKARLKAILGPIVDPTLMCVARGAVTALLHPAAPKTGAPASAAQVAPAELGTAYAQIAADLGWPAAVR